MQACEGEIPVLSPEEGENKANYELVGVTHVTT